MTGETLLDGERPVKALGVLVGRGVAVTTACADGSSPSAPSSKMRRPSASRVRLVSSPGERRAECVAAANELGFAVPCPTEEPATAGRPMACTLARTITATPCVGMEGLPAYRVFALEFSGFDVPSRYVGVDGKAIGHIVIEARSHSDSPPVPCIGATRLGTVKVGDRMLDQYRCPRDSVRIQREAMHGEGAHAGHILVEWTDSGIDYIVSAHGHTAANLDVLKRLVGSVRLIPPGST